MRHATNGGGVALRLPVSPAERDLMDVRPPAATTEPDYRRLLELVQAIVWRADASTFQTTFASGEALDVLGYPADAWTREPKFWVNHLHPDDHDRVIALSSEAVREGRTHDFDYRMIGADGGVVWLRNIVTVVMVDGAPAELVGVTVPIGERKRAEFEATQLRMELGRVTRAAALGELSALLAHELNQPLGAIVTNAETALLQLRTGSIQPEAMTAILHDIRRDAERGGQVVHGLHKLLRRGSGTREPISVPGLVGDVVNLLRPLLLARGVRLSVSVPPLPDVEGDVVQLQQVLMNLIINSVDAIDGNGAGGLREITVGARSAGDFIEIAVSDTGSGISATVLARLFEPFVTTKAGGIGVGLAMCRRIVEAHGGRISGENNVDGGATFRFTIRRAEAREEEAA